jgi:hypothetical protein
MHAPNHHHNASIFLNHHAIGTGSHMLPPRPRLHLRGHLRGSRQSGSDHQGLSGLARKQRGGRGPYKGRERTGARGSGRAVFDLRVNLQLRFEKMRGVSGR